jgi:hypothetical protein
MMAPGSVRIVLFVCPVCGVVIKTNEPQDGTLMGPKGWPMAQHAPARLFSTIAATVARIASLHEAVRHENDDRGSVDTSTSRGSGQGGYRELLAAQMHEVPLAVPGYEGFIRNQTPLLVFEFSEVGILSIGPRPRAEFPLQIDHRATSAQRFAKCGAPKCLMNVVVPSIDFGV